ncbi:MAG: hypothetical protein P4L84_20970 [Isosphaeraceae bacterium]|nr:hypothetical protein [Isosphaeraceae bacterium]
MTEHKADRRPIRHGVAILTLGLSVFLTAGASHAAEAQTGTSGKGVRRALIVCGLPGDEDHRKLYAGVMEKLAKALIEQYGFPATEVLVRFGGETRPTDGPALKSSRGPSSGEGIAADVAELRKRLTADDSLWVIVLGHGHLDGRRAYLNLPGPDLDERGFGKLFEGLKAREQVFFITSSASGFFLKPLAQPGRIVITATEPDREVNETLFPQALADVLASPPEGIDHDKNGSISVFELYLSVVANVMQRYVDDENLATEHAKIDDNGDGRGSELQAQYLPEELGGTAGKDEKPTAGPKGDGQLASQVLIGAVPQPAKDQSNGSTEAAKK